MAGAEKHYIMPRAEFDKPVKLAIVMSPYYKDIADNMLAGAVAEIEAVGGTYDSEWLSLGEVQVWGQWSAPYEEWIATEDWKRIKDPQIREIWQKMTEFRGKPREFKSLQFQNHLVSPSS